jgi:hypothetical protein
MSGRGSTLERLYRLEIYPYYEYIIAISMLPYLLTCGKFH